MNNEEIYKEAYTKAERERALEELFDILNRIKNDPSAMKDFLPSDLPTDEITKKNLAAEMAKEFVNGANKNIKRKYLEGYLRILKGDDARRKNIQHLVESCNPSYR